MAKGQTMSQAEPYIVGGRSYATIKAARIEAKRISGRTGKAAYIRQRKKGGQVVACETVTAKPKQIHTQTRTKTLANGTKLNVTFHGEQEGL